MSADRNRSTQGSRECPLSCAAHRPSTQGRIVDGTSQGGGQRIGRLICTIRGDSAQLRHSMANVV